jgi:hypothetical protein
LSSRSPRARRARRRPRSSPSESNSTKSGASSGIRTAPYFSLRGKRAGRYAGFCPVPSSEEHDTVTAISLGTTLPQPSSGLPGNSASSLGVPCLTLLRTRFTQRARSLGPLVVSYTTVSPLPRWPDPKAQTPWRSTLCCTFSRIAPGGCYPPSCSVEPGRSSARSRSSVTRPSGRPICRAQASGS